MSKISFLRGAFGFMAALVCLAIAPTSAHAANDIAKAKKLPAAPITTTVTATPKAGWMPGGYGHLKFVYVNHGDKPAKVMAWAGEYRATADGPVLFHWTWTPKHKTIEPGKTLTMGLTAWMSPKVSKVVGRHPALLNGTSTFEIDGKKMQSPYHTTVSVARLDEPLKKVVQGQVGVELQASRFQHFTSLPKVLAFFNKIYQAETELTGYSPFQGKPIIYKEVPDNPSWAYAGNPISINTKFVKSTIEDWNKGVVSFGWVHEMGHDYDNGCGGWYIWNGASAEAQANIKLYYIFDKMITADSPFAARAWQKWEGDNNYLVTGRQFVNRVILAAADDYLSNAKRDWQSMDANEINTFYMKLVRHYGWGVMKKWYRTYQTMKKSKEAGPKSPEDKINLNCAVMSTITGKDLVPLYTRWRFPVTREKVKAMEAKYDIAKAVPSGPIDTFGKIAPEPLRPFNSTASR